MSIDIRSRFERSGVVRGQFVEREGRRFSTTVRGEGTAAEFARVVPPFASLATGPVSTRSNGVAHEVGSLAVRYAISFTVVIVVINVFLRADKNNDFFLYTLK